MKIGVLSDLRIDELGPPPSPRHEPDVLVLAGDCGSGAATRDWATRSYECPIIQVLGNHCYYDADIPTVDREFKHSTWGTNVHFLQNETLVLRGVRFIGSTLWTDFDLFGDAPTALFLAQEGCEDYQRIHDREGRRIHPLDTQALHRRDAKYLWKTATERYDDGHSVVVTHHAPSPHSIAPRHRSEWMSACEASRLDELVVEADAMLWVHGGEHDSADYRIGGTRVISNPRGLPGERREVGEFRYDYVVDI